MFYIEEKPALKLPELTSLFIKLPFINKYIENQIAQQKLYNYNSKTDTYELPTTRLFFLVDLLIKYDDIEITFYKSDIKPITLTCDSMNFKYKPYDYQKDGINYGLNHKGWLLLDDQGLGKTLQMIYLAETLYKLGELDHCFIICGVNNLKFNWYREILKFSELSCKILGQKIKKNGDIIIGSVKDRLLDLSSDIKEFFVITNIETLQNKDFVKYFKKSKTKFGMIVLDEAHRVKNQSAKATDTLLKLSADRCVALTGTLIMNNPENAYVALKWTGNLKSCYTDFCSMYNIYGGFNNAQVVGYKNLDLLQELIASCSLRRKKEEVLELPPKTYEVEYIEMLPKQRELYNEVLDGVTKDLNLLSKKKKISIMDELVMNMRLRQITAYPGILSTTVTESAKLDRLEELVEDIVNQGDKVLVFCSFKSTVPEIDRRLEKYNPLICTGDTKDIDIDKYKELFQNDDKYKVLICTWQKMGTGHTLTAANYVIFIDTPWTDADFQQASDRAYRIGQLKHTHIITLVCVGTYDERVLEILNNKEILSSYLIDNQDKGLTQIKDFDSIN